MIALYAKPRMKRFYTLLLSLLTGLSSYSQTQQTQFTLSDTTFIVGSHFRARIDIEADNRNIREYHMPLFDSIADFMKAHPEIVFAIESYTDQRGSDSSNLKLSQMRASFIKRNLTEKGVLEFNLAAVGMGEGNPVVSQATIDAEKDQSKKEVLYSKNRRYEFRIVYIYKSLFSLTDSTFDVGGLLRCYILFDFNKTTIRPESKPLLDSIAKFLIAHPNLTVEVNNHRDSRGSDMYSTDLSKTRSRSVCEYLIAQGVPKERVMYRGYGETMPLFTDAYILKHKSKDAQEQMHQLNRRTELKIISVK